MVGIRAPTARRARPQGARAGDRGHLGIRGAFSGIVEMSVQGGLVMDGPSLRASTRSGNPLENRL
jgi:hypothetical protein